MDFARLIEYTNRKNIFAVHNHIRLTEVELDRAAAEMTICSDSQNPLGAMHGGAYFTMADCAASAAARSNGMQYVTLNSSFEFIRSVKEGTVCATAKVRHRGRTICLVAVEVTNEEGRLLAEGKFTMFCMGEPMII
ncbi:MAG: PaaI family thioesterase, partial [Clostridia bacterium]|nr:PaaI family thioesterase [Clostridia bacterium]